MDVAVFAIDTRRRYEVNTRFSNALTLEQDQGKLT